MSNNRYFIIFYTYPSIFGGQDIGQACTQTQNGKYINLNSLIQELSVEKAYGMPVVLTNIIEISESDYRDFNQ